MSVSEPGKVPTVRFTDFDSTWSESAVRKVFSIFNGYAFSSSDSSDSGCRWIKIADVGVQQMKDDNTAFLPENFRDKHPKFVLRSGDVVIALTRPFLNGQLKISLISDAHAGALLNQRVGKLVTRNIPLFVYYQLQRRGLAYQIDARISGTDPPNLAPSEIATLPIFMPKEPEQQKIADFLTAVDTRIQQLSQKKTLLERWKKGLMQQLFSQILRFKDDNGNDFPDWEEKRLGGLCSTLKSGKGITAQRINTNGLYPVFGGNGLRGYTDAFTHDCDVVLIGRQGALCGNINRSKGKSYISEHAVAVIANETSTNEWLAQRLEYMKLNRLSESSAQPGLAVNKLARIKLETPCQKEQTKIANCLTAIDQKIDTVAQQIQKTKTFKQGLLQQMFV